MTILQSLMRRRSLPLASGDPALIKLLGGYGPTASGVTVTAGTALGLTAVWSAVLLTSSTVAAMPAKVWRDGPDGRVEVNSGLFKDPMNPELDLTWFEGLEYFVGSMCLYGAAVAFKVRNQLGDRVMSLIPMNPTTVYPYVEAGKKLFRVQGQAEPLTPADILYLPGWSDDGIRGVSPIEAEREAIGAAIAARTAGARLFDAGMLLGGVLQTDQELDRDQAELTKQRWRDKVAGYAKAYEIAVLDRGLKFTPASIPPKDAQWIEAQQFGIAEVSRIFRIPPALLFEYMSTGNVEADKLGNQWLRFGLDQLLVRLERRLSLHLLPRGQFVEFERGGILRGTPKEQAEVEKIQIDSGVLTVDEARALHNRPPAPPPPPSSPTAPPVPAASPLADGTPPGARSARTTNIALRQEPIMVNVPAPDVYVEPPVVNVTVEAPNVNVEPARVDVAPPTVNVTPEITVAPADVRFEPTVEVTVPPRDVRFIRDQQGRVTGAETVDGA